MPENNYPINPAHNSVDWVIADAQAGGPMEQQTAPTGGRPDLPGHGPQSEAGKKPQGFWAKLRYAFATEHESFNQFPEEEMKLLNKVADAVIQRRLAAPTLMFLETVRPLNFLGSQVLVFFEPIVAMVISTKELGMFAKILEKRKSIPLLIDIIEKKDDALRASPSK